MLLVSIKFVSFEVTKVMTGSPSNLVITDAACISAVCFFFSGLQEVCILLAFTAPLMGVSVSQRLEPQRYVSESTFLFWSEETSRFRKQVLIDMFDEF